MFRLIRPWMIVVIILALPNLNAQYTANAEKMAWGNSASVSNGILTIVAYASSAGLPSGTKINFVLNAQTKIVCSGCGGGDKRVPLSEIENYHRVRVQYVESAGKNMAMNVVLSEPIRATGASTPLPQVGQQNHLSDTAPRPTEGPNSQWPPRSFSGAEQRMRLATGTVKAVSKTELTLVLDAMSAAIAPDGAKELTFAITPGTTITGRDEGQGAAITYDVQNGQLIATRVKFRSKNDRGCNAQGKNCRGPR